jgi:hypothetical protein
VRGKPPVLSPHSTTGNRGLSLITMLQELELGVAVRIE